MKSYPDAVHQFIAQNVEGRTTKELVTLVNAEFGLSFTEGKMKSYKGNHKLKSGIGQGIPAGTPTKKYPAEVREFIKANYVGVGHQGMADMLNKEFGTSYTKGQMKAIYARLKLNSGRTGRFPKGHVPPNKGKKGIRLSPDTEFKKGDRPHNSKPIGTEALRSDGYVWTKIAEPNKWRQKHVLIWEEANGPRPKKHGIIFGDGNRLNFDLDNLILVSMAQLVMLNKKGLIRTDAELTRTGIIIADLHIKIAERKRRK